jgi:hypothetical protein
VGSERLRRWFPIAAELARLKCYELRLGTDPARRGASTVAALVALASEEETITSGRRPPS